jgi:hypothetical protein
MKIIIGTSFLVFHLLYSGANAFSIPTAAKYRTIASTTTTTTTTLNSSSRSKTGEQNHVHDKRYDIETKSKYPASPALKRLARQILDRSDTLKSAGFYDPQQSQYPPVVAGAKTNIALFLLALGYKWYRSIFINKASRLILLLLFFSSCTIATIIIMKFLCQVSRHRI